MSLTNFEGFNYPYGENLLYTDCHPILVSILKPLNDIFPSISSYSIGILNMFMLLSFILTASVLQRLLEEIKVHGLSAILGSWAILILAPQVFRLQGHFALSYSFVIPLCFLWLLRFMQSKKSNNYILKLTLINAFFLFVHAYLGIISISILLAFFLINLIHKPSINKKMIWLLASSFLSMIPFLVVKLLSDSHRFRTNNPYGFFEYYADIDTVFLPHTGPLKSYLMNLLPTFTQTWEGLSYVGAGTIVLLPFMLIQFYNNYRQNEVTVLHQIVLASILLLLFSFGMPFRFGLEGMVDSVPILKQFRAIGRFSWVFYFAISVTAIYFMNQLAAKIPSRVGRVAAILSLPALMIIEGTPYHIALGKGITKEQNNFKLAKLNPDFTELINSIDPSQFQSIIPIPFYHIGSENHEKEASNKTYLNSILLSYHTSLPLTSSYLSRVSITESKNAMQFFAPNHYTKGIQSDLPSELPFIVFWNTDEKLTTEEENLLSKVNWIIEKESNKIGSLPYSTVFENSVQNLLIEFSKDSSLIKKGNYYVSDFSKKFYNSKFNTKEDSTLFRGEKSLLVDQQKRNKLFEIKTAELDANQLYEASVWLSNSSENSGQDDLNHLTFKLEEKDKNNEIIHTAEKSVMSSFIHFENWTLSHFNFTPKSPSSLLEFSIVGNSPQANTSYAASFLIRDTELNVFKILKGERDHPNHLVKNNHSVKREK